MLVSPNRLLQCKESPLPPSLRAVGSATPTITTEDKILRSALALSTSNCGGVELPTGAVENPVDSPVEKAVNNLMPGWSNTTDSLPVSLTKILPRQLIVAAAVTLQNLDFCLDDSIHTGPFDNRVPYIASWVQ